MLTDCEFQTSRKIFIIDSFFLNWQQKKKLHSLFIIIFFLLHLVCFSLVAIFSVNCYRLKIENLNDLENLHEMRENNFGNMFFFFSFSENQVRRFKSRIKNCVFPFLLRKKFLPIFVTLFWIILVNEMFVLMVCVALGHTFLTLCTNR